MVGLGLRERNRRAAMIDVQRVAVQMMRDQGFDEVTVEQIAAQAAVSPSTMYRYFGTKEALVLWGDRSEHLVEEFAAAPGDEATPLGDVFVAAATAIYTADEADLLDQLRLVFGHAALTIAFEHQLLTRRREVAAVAATRRGASSAGIRDEAFAAAHLGILLAMLERWQAGDGAKSLTKMLAKGAEALRR